MADATTYGSNDHLGALRTTLSGAFVAPARFDPLGIVSGFRAYRVYTELANKPDAELASLGLKREDLPRIALDAVRAD